jgi:hypothetical protein
MDEPQMSDREPDYRYSIRFYSAWGVLAIFLSAWGFSKLVDGADGIEIAAFVGSLVLTLAIAVLLVRVLVKRAKSRR